ncbi:tRNA synthetases class I, catalytic domain-containing protein [Chytriomyces sp. MP71]|nr:tRNA synthetases class I, catalytic domain-containing protein [Chytriomyces sp. MP71]
MSEASVTLFKSLGFSDQKAQETAANKKICGRFEKLVHDVNPKGSTAFVALLYTLASTATPLAGSTHLEFIGRAIVAEKLKTNDQIAAAIKFAESVKTNSIDVKAFDEACGVGVEVSVEDIQAGINKLFVVKKDDIEKKGHGALGIIIAEMKKEQRWANAAVVKAEVEKKLVEVLGPKGDPKAAPKKPTSTPTANAKPAAVPAKPTIAELAKTLRFAREGALAQLHKPGENPQINPKLMEEHLKRTGRKVITRFPPEPNGFLHIGHAKAINTNFGYAQAYGGITNLRYDDTNPEAEEEKYFTSILDTVRWLGFEPTNITYSSDHFQALYDLAVQLIKKDKAYVCHCTGEEIHEQRGGDSMGPRFECKHRSRPISESMLEFERMKNGEYGEGEAILRMKMDMNNPNPQFWDLIAYRVLLSHHHRTGDAWCIYPTYDYTHCICDSFEDITHSLCTTEFQQSRESYYWLVDALEIYKPVQWEYGRLALTYAIMSKRKLLQLVNEKHVIGWDDPRLYTMVGLRRRGFTPEAINAFVRELGVTTSNSIIPAERLENFVRDHLNEVAPRLMVVLEPLKVTITNLPEHHHEYITVPNKPRDDNMGTHVIPFTRTVYIDASDFKEQDDPEFFRLILGKSVGLLNVPRPVIAKEVVKDASGKVIEVKAVIEDNNKNKPKAYIQWVAESKKDKSPVQVEVRNYSNLFLHPNPTDKKAVPGGWLSDINPNSLVVLDQAMAEVGIRVSKVEDKYQFVRLGYYCVDKDSDLEADKFVLNRTVSLKEDSGKQ